uniref:Rx N-terminal domain-containing protein n=2 Tax=Aegilops tauschii subsp. strangulata TaxID=200361 RepID=A0A452ZH48_AEGTS
SMCTIRPFVQGSEHIPCNFHQPPALFSWTPLVISALPSEELKMELVISAVAGELLTRFVTFLADRYHSSRRVQPEEKQLKRLYQLLLRARMVIEEADRRYITNLGMLEQLSMLADAMYRGYWALDASRYISLQESMEEEGEVRNPSSPKRLRMVHGSARENKDTYPVDLKGALESLEDVVAGMTEFVVLLGGCDRMLRQPYDAYLYNDNIMFGRHAEKQKLMNFMLEHGSSGGVPAVLPVIGGPMVMKRTLLAHVCKDERVRSHFSSILHLNGDSFSTLADHDHSLLLGKILVVVELVSDVDEDDWAKFCLAVATSMDNGSKVVIISQLKSTERLGTVESILLNTLSYEEFSYLFKTLAFGSANPVQHPRLARIADELAREFQYDSSLGAAILFADLMRRNLSVHF